MPGEPFEVWKVDGLPVVSAPAEIDVANAGQLRRALRRALAIHPTVVVDLSNTDFCDSTGLSVLITARKRATAKRGEVRLAACTPQVLRVFNVTGVDTIFPIFPSLVEAVGAAADPAAAT